MRRSIALAALLAFAVAAAVAITIAAREGDEDAEMRVASSRALGVAAIANTDRSPELALLLGLEALARVQGEPWERRYDARHGLLTALERNARLGGILRGHKGGAVAVAFSPQGKTLAVSAADGTVSLWKISSHSLIGELHGHTGRVLDVAFSPDGRTLATAGSDETVKLWDVERRSLVGELHGHTGSVNDVAFSPDGRTLATASAYSDGDGTLRVWDLSRRVPLGKPLQVSAVAMRFSEDGKTLTFLSVIGDVTDYDMTRRPAFREPSFDTGYTEYGPADLSPDTRKLLTLGEDGLRLWSIARRPPRDLPLRVETYDEQYALAWAPNGRTFATASRDEPSPIPDTEGTVMLWDAARRAPLGKPLRFHNGGVYSLTFSPDGQTLAVAGADGTVRLWDISPAAPLGRSLGSDSESAISPGGETSVSASEDGRVTLWDVARGVSFGEPLVLDVPDDEYADWSITTGPKGRVAALVVWEGAVTLWDTDSGARIGDPLPFPSGSVHDVVFSPDGRTLAVVDWDSRITLWDIERGKPRGAPIRIRGDITNVIFSPDGRLLAIGTGLIRVWDVASRVAIGKPIAGRDDESFIFGPEGKTIIARSRPGAADNEGTIRVWDVANGSPIGEPFPGWTVYGYDISLALSPDGRTLAAQSDAGLELWDIARGGPLGEALSPTSEGVVFGPDGRTLATGADLSAATSGGGPMIVWDRILMSSEISEWRERVCAIVTRNLTGAEWRLYLPDEPYKRTCPQFD